jgi:hypothetical protein
MRDGELKALHKAGYEVLYERGDELVTLLVEALEPSMGWLVLRPSDTDSDDGQLSADETLAVAPEGLEVLVEEGDELLPLQVVEGSRGHDEELPWVILRAVPG